MTLESYKGRKARRVSPENNHLGTPHDEPMMQPLPESKPATENTAPKMLVREPETGDFVPALEVHPDGTSQGTYVIGANAAARSVFVPGEIPRYVTSHPQLIDASSREQHEKHGFGD